LGMGGRSSKANIVVVGLDNAGKTTLLHRMQPRRGAPADEAPTVGYGVEEFKRGGVKFTAFDMSGAHKYRSLWEKYYSDSQGVIFVVDSAGTDRIALAKDELWELLGHEDMKRRNVPILIFANKKDLPSAMSEASIMKALELHKIEDRPYHIAASNALSGEGVDEGVAWLADRLKSHGK